MFLFLSLLPLACPVASAADPWHLAGWGARAVVEFPRPSTEPGVDVGGVKVLCLGRTKTDGSDYRVVDAAGHPLPFQIMFHDAARYSLLSFRVTDPRQRYFIYFGNPQAPRAAEEIVADPAPGSGPPQGAWIPRYGLTLVTIQRPEGDNPKTVSEMARLMAGSRAKHGGAYQRRIADGFNQFGPSDYYISIYRGWIRIPKTDKYWFCTDSNEASFSFLDGKDLIHWPGRHTVDRGLHGEKNASHEVTEGLHYVEYYQEEVLLQQMSFLGWRPHSDSGPFSGIPESVYTAPHEGVVMRYESPAVPLPVFEPQIVDSVWPEKRLGSQYTGCRFTIPESVRPPEGTACQWDFGDGQRGSGVSTNHVYLRTGEYAVTLSVAGQQGPAVARWPFLVYEIQEVTDEMKEGQVWEYARTVRGYDRAAMDAATLSEQAFLLAEGGDTAEALAAGRDFVARFGAGETQRVAAVRMLIADCAARLGPAGADEAVANYRAAAAAETSTVRRVEAMAGLIRVLGVEKRAMAEADAALAEAEALMKKSPKDEASLAAWRGALIAAGDGRLWDGKREEANGFYRRAEAVSRQVIPPQVRAARVGAYPDSIQDYLNAKDFGAAVDLVDKWEDVFPTEKTKGQTFFWRGRIAHVRGQEAEAARWLEKSLGLVEGAAFETEARWLLAEALEKLGRADDARRELARLAASGLSDRFTALANEKLKAPPAKKN